MLMAREAAVEHRPFDASTRLSDHRLRDRIARPSVRVTQITPSVEGEFLLHRAVGVGDGGPRAKVVLQDVVDGWSFHDYTIHLQ